MSELKCELCEHLKQKSSQDRYMWRRISVNNCKHDLQFLFCLCSKERFIHLTQRETTISIPKEHCM